MNKITIFCCPVCKQPLFLNGNSFNCEKKHTFDIAKEGYINLMLANQKKSKVPGDSKEMILARKNFLNLGCYEKLAESIAELVINHKNSTSTNHYNIFDAGCGEGYYLDHIAKSLKSETDINYSAADISKEGVKEAAKRGNKVNLAVASVYDLPLVNDSLDCLISVFSPTPSAEFSRVIKDSGVVIIVRPGAGHLLELKHKLYTEAYLNDEDKLEMSNFAEIERHKLNYKFTISGKENILNLIKMTPYYHNTDQNKIMEMLDKNKMLETGAEFVITISKKNPKLENI